MQIHISQGVGTGPTKLAAFDAALNSAGIANYNLLRLSSVIPPESNIVIHEDSMQKWMPGKWGDRLYVVIAEMRADTLNEEAWAGIGWVQDKSTGRGLFVEHEGRNEQSVRKDISQTLHALMATRNIDFGPIRMEVAGCICAGEPACAMVVAAYQASDWKNQSNLIEE